MTGCCMSRDGKELEIHIGAYHITISELVKVIGFIAAMSGAVIAITFRLDAVENGHYNLKHTIDREIAAVRASQVRSEARTTQQYQNIREDIRDLRRDLRRSMQPEPRDLRHEILRQHYEPLDPE